MKPLNVIQRHSLSCILLMTITILFILAGCKKDEALSVFDNEILGEWRWIKTQIGYPDTTYTPSEGNTRSIRFEKTEVYYYMNDKLQYSFPYHFEVEYEHTLDTLLDSIKVLVLSERPYSYYSIYNDTLVIDATYRDLGADFYARK